MPSRMEVLKIDKSQQGLPPDLDAIPREITEADRQLYARVTSTSLSQEQIDVILSPERGFPMQDAVLAVHWHPEFVPLDLAMRRVETMFPNRSDELIIPTQHNELMSVNGYSGVEVDCYSHGFNRKVQLLLHFRENNIREATVLKAMLRHTFKYRASQLFEFLEAVVEDDKDSVRQEAGGKTGADETLVEFCRIHARKLLTMIEENWSETPDSMIKNKLLTNYMYGLHPLYGDRYIQRVQMFLKEIKKIVKRNFSLKYFYRASEIIEEARALGAGVVIPHPEQFWPILLADYDVDGYEVWNPQSREYTEFLIDVVRRHNKSPRYESRQLLVFMGDDCHLGEKTKPREERDEEKASREVGWQPAWEDMSLRKLLIVSGLCRASVLAEYRERLG